MLGLCIVPPAMLTMPGPQFLEHTSKLAELYEADLPSASSFNGERECWMVKWQKQLVQHGKGSLPISVRATLQQTSSNIRVLLQILSTLPVTTCLAERSFSTLKNLNITYVHQLNSCSIHCNNLVQTAYQFIERSNLEARITSKGRKLKSRVEKSSTKKKESLLECMCMVDINRSDVVSKDAVIQSLEDDNFALRFRVINTHCGDIMSNFL